MNFDFSHLLDGLSAAQLKSEAVRLKKVLKDRHKARENAKGGDADHLDQVIELRTAKLADIEDRLKGSSTAPTVDEGRALVDRVNDLEKQNADLRTKLANIPPPAK